MPVGTIDNLEHSETEHWGALRLTLMDGSYAYEFVTIDGQVLDSGVVVCG